MRRKIIPMSMTRISLIWRRGYDQVFLDKSKFILTKCLHNTLVFVLKTNLDFCKFVLICPFLSCICLDKNKTNYFLSWWIKKVGPSLIQGKHRSGKARQSVRFMGLHGIGNARRVAKAVQRWGIYTSQIASINPTSSTIYKVYNNIRHRFSYSRQILIFCKFVLICPFLSWICLDKQDNFFVLVDQESLQLLKSCLELNENVLNAEDILTFWSVIEKWER